MFSINIISKSPVYEQLTEQIERYILTGLLREGDQLPSVRSLSAELSVNPNTVQRTYSELDARRILLSVPGKGCFVAENASALLRQKCLGEEGRLRQLLRELRSAGITEEEILRSVKKEYEREEKP